MSRSLRSMLLLLLAFSTSATAADVSIQLDAGSGLSVKNNTGAIERLRVDEATGNVSRNGMLFLHTTGGINLFLGRFAGNLGTTGLANTGIGEGALARLLSEQRAVIAALASRLERLESR